MKYVFDTSSLSRLKHFFPDVFKRVWIGLDAMVVSGDLVSTREVWTEMQRGSPHPKTTSRFKERKRIFTTPSPEEMSFVAQIFAIKHFQGLIGSRQRLKGDPVADPFVIACAKVHNGTVVTEEALADHAAKIPNVCAHFKIKCLDLEGFMKEQGWSF